MTSAIRSEAEKERAAWGTTEQPQPMLDLRFETGDALALPYYGIAAIRLAGGVLTLYLEQCTVTLHGRHLRELHRALTGHEVPFIQERHVSEFGAGDEEPYIDRIELGAPGLTGLAKKAG